MRHYQEMLELQNLVAAEPAIEDPRNATIEEANEYVGANVCGECHRKAYAAWKETPHAHATSSIKTGRVGQEADYISRIHDAECVACHVTGWDPKLFVRYNSGYVSERESAHLLGQQCENCHGPGGRHTELERQFAKDKNLTGDVTKFRKLAQLFVDEAAENQCAKCHDGDNDPNFNSKTFAEYWEKIKHPGKD
jgi:hypothetical protein